MPNKCTQRIADHTDYVDCGKPVLRANRCAEHLHEEAQGLLRLIKTHELAIADCRRRLQDLNTEKG